VEKTLASEWWGSYRSIKKRVVRNAGRVGSRPNQWMLLGMKTDRIQTDVADTYTDTYNCSFLDRILGSNSDTDNMFCVE
jgi:hypothetical protein